MSSLRSRLGKPLKAVTNIVKNGDDEFILTGFPSVKVAMQSVDLEQQTKLATLWNCQFCPKDDDGNPASPVPKAFDAEAVGQVKTVHHYLVPEEAEKPYALAEVAELYISDPMLFLQLYGAAAACMGGLKIVGNVLTGGEDLGELAGGKLPSAEASEPASGSV